MTTSLKEKLFGNMGAGIIVVLILIIGWFGREAYYDMKNDFKIHAEKQEKDLEKINDKIVDLRVEVATLNTHVGVLIDRGD